MPTIEDTVKTAGGEPIPDCPVDVELLASETGDVGPGYLTGSDYTIIAAWSTTTDSDGAWSATVEANADITPAGTVYRVTERPRGAPVVVHYVEVPDASGPHWLGDILTDAPATVESAALAVETAARIAADALLAPLGTAAATIPDPAAGNAGAWHLDTDDDGGTPWRSNGVSNIQGAAGVAYEAALDRLWLPTSQIDSGTGVTRTQLKNWPVLSLPAGSDRLIRTTVSPPAHWESLDLDVIWANDGATSGNVRWRCDTDLAAIGQAVAQHAAGTVQLVAAGADSVLTSTRLLDDFALTAANYLSFGVWRLAADATDTLEDDVAIVGVLLTRVS